MNLPRHLRNTFLTGIFAIIPVAVTVFVLMYVEGETRRLFRLKIPFLGVLIAIVGIYFVGLFVKSVLGAWIIGLIDRLLMRMPLLNEAYKAWKHVSVTPGGKEGIYARCVLISDGSCSMRMLGFTSGEPLEGDPDTLCVFVPNAPNPINGRLYFVPRSRCALLDIGPEEAFKFLLSGGNYVPPEIAAQTRPAAAAAIS
jgi:uncharacterized membrane protein